MRAGLDQVMVSPRGPPRLLSGVLAVLGGVKVIEMLYSLTDTRELLVW